MWSFLDYFGFELHLHALMFLGFNGSTIWWDCTNLKGKWAPSLNMSLLLRVTPNSKNNASFMRELFAIKVTVTKVVISRGEGGPLQIHEGFNATAQIIPQKKFMHR